MVLDGGAEMQKLMGELLPQMPTGIRWDIKRAIGAEGWRRGEAREIDRLFEENIGQNADIIVLWFFSGEFQHREYVIQKIRETSPEVQRRLEQAIGEKQETLLNNPQTRKPGNAFVYLIRQEDFANKQFFFKIGQTKKPSEASTRASNEQLPSSSPVGCYVFPQQGRCEKRGETST